jgi:hypothetical protein
MIFGDFSKTVENIQVSLKFDKNNRCLTWRRMYICDVSLNSSWNEKYFSQSCREKSKHILCSTTFLQKSCPLWDNVGKFCRPGEATDDNITWRMRFACWVTKATDTHSEYVILIAFSRQQWLHESASMLRYMQVACNFRIETCSSEQNPNPAVLLHV